MWEQDCGCVPVVDSSNVVIGLITDRDIAMAAYTQGKLLAQVVVGDVMTRNVLSCRPTETLHAAERRMRERQVRRLPVTDGTGVLVGMISVNDLVLEAARQRGSARSQTVVAELTETLADICRHRAAEQIAPVA
jgi:CBS domain-containing protein